MRTNELIEQISSDLAITKFYEENINEFGNRLIYSALTAWGKVQVLDKSYVQIENFNEESSSYLYVLNKLKNVYDGLKNVIPHNEWLGDEESNKEFPKYILKNLIFCYMITETENKGRITLTPSKEITFNNNKLVLGGSSWNNKMDGKFSAGLGVWKSNCSNLHEDYKEFFNIPRCSIEEYYKDLRKGADWKKTNLSGEYEIFMIGTGLWHKRAWRKLQQNKIPLGISVVRDINNEYEYKLLLNENSNLFVASLDRWYKEENEISRILYALEYYNGKPSIFKAKKNKDMVELHCHSELPNTEKRILLMSSWPKRRYDDMYFRQISEVLWSDIEIMLSNLGIKVVCS